MKLLHLLFFARVFALADADEYHSDEVACEASVKDWQTNLPKWYAAKHSCICSDHGEIEHTVRTLCKSDEEFCCPATGRCHTSRQDYIDLKHKQGVEVSAEESPYIATVEVNEYCTTYIGDDIPDGRAEVCFLFDFDNSQPGNVYSCQYEINGVLCNSCSQCASDDTKDNWDCTNIPGIEGFPANVITPTGNCMSIWGDNCPVEWTTQAIREPPAQANDSGFGSFKAGFVAVSALAAFTSAII